MMIFSWILPIFICLCWWKYLTYRFSHLPWTCQVDFLKLFLDWFSTESGMIPSELPLKGNNVFLIPKNLVDTCLYEDISMCIFFYTLEVNPVQRLLKNTGVPNFEWLKFPSWKIVWCENLCSNALWSSRGCVKNWCLFTRKTYQKRRMFFLPLWKIQSFFDLFLVRLIQFVPTISQQEAPELAPRFKKDWGDFARWDLHGTTWFFPVKKKHGGKSAGQRILFKTFQKKWWVKLPESKSRIKSKLLDPRRVAELFWPCWVGRQMRNCWDDHPFKRIKPQLIGEPPKWLPKFQVINKV